MKIKSITSDRIEFDNGSEITYFHYSVCCENNYADFEYLKDETGIFDYDFDEDLGFEEDRYGFRFGNKERMYFVPCYSERNCYCSSYVNIYYNDKRVLVAECEMILG